MDDKNPKADNSPASKGAGNSLASDIVPQKGERALTIGQTGSGKTVFNRWLLTRIENSPTIIYDTKEEPKFNSLPNSSRVTSWDNVVRAVDNPAIDYVIFQPPLRDSADPEIMDRYLERHYQQFHDCTAYIDEIYQFHKGAHSGPGLLGLLTRGRSKGITTLMSTQRPKFLTRFAISETQKFYVMKITFNDDRKALADFIPDYDAKNPPDLPEHGFLFYKTGDNSSRIFGAVKMDEKDPKEYTDPVAVETVVRRHNWL